HRPPPRPRAGRRYRCGSGDRGARMPRDGSQPGTLRVGATVQRVPGGTGIVPVRPAFTGSGNCSVAPPFAAPETSTDCAPASAICPPQETETLGALEPPPQPA